MEVKTPTKKAQEANALPPLTEGFLRPIPLALCTNLGYNNYIKMI